MTKVSEFVRNTSDTWLPTVQTGVAINITSTMATDTADDYPAAPRMTSVITVVVVVIVVLAVIAAIAIFIYCYCFKRRKQLNKQAIAEHAQYRYTIKDPPSSVFSVEKGLTPIEATNVTSERHLRYNGEPAISSLPNSGRSVSYDYLRDGDKNQPWPSLRNSVASDNGYYGSDTLHVSTSQLSRSVGQGQGFLEDSDNTPERSLSSDHIQRGGWHGVCRRPGSKASSLGRDSGLGGSQETCLSYQADLKSSLSNFSMSSMEAEDDIDSPCDRPKSLPPFYGNWPLEIKKMEDIPIRSMFPGKACLDENDNQPDVYKQIQLLRDKFYTMRNQTGVRDEANAQMMGTPNFVISILNSEGGHLQLFDGSATLAIPKDALPFEHEVYLYAYYENACIDGKSYLRRVIECGPDGLTFKKPVCLSFIPRLIPCDDSENETDLRLNVVFKNNEPEKWRSLKKKESFFHAEDEFVSIHVDHFTRFTVEPAGGSVQLTSGSPPGQMTSQTSQEGDTRKFYVSVFVGQSAGGVTQYRVCFIERNKERLKKHSNDMAQEGFRQAIASPKLFSVTPQGQDVRVEIPSLHGCEFKSPSKKHVIPVDEFDEQTVEDIGPPQREFLLGLTKHNTEGLFEVAVFQEGIHDKVLTLCISMNINYLKEKVSSDSTELTHRDVLEFLAGNRLAAYYPNVCFPKHMKLDICTKVEGSQSHGWYKLAETARIPGNKSSWLESYVRGKQVTPCYVVLDFIEAQLIAKEVGIGEACDQLARMLERAGFEAAADYCATWKSELLRQSTHKSPQKDKFGRFSYGRRDLYPNLSPSREELDTIVEENVFREGSIGRGPSSQTRAKMRLSFEQENLPNGVVLPPANRQYLVENLSNLNISQPHGYDNSGLSESHTVMSLPSPNQAPYTISRPYDSTPVANRRPNKVLLKANREKSGRNDSGIGSDIASPVEHDNERSSHI